MFSRMLCSYLDWTWTLHKLHLLLHIRPLLCQCSVLGGIFSLDYRVDGGEMTGNKERDTERHATKVPGQTWTRDIVAFLPLHLIETVEIQKGNERRERGAWQATKARITPGDDLNFLFFFCFFLNWGLFCPQALKGNPSPTYWSRRPAVSPAAWGFCSGCILTPSCRTPGLTSRPACCCEYNIRLDHQVFDTATVRRYH